MRWNWHNAATLALLLSAVMVFGQEIMITSQPVSQSSFSGARVTFAVKARGKGPLTYQWRKNGAKLSNGVRISGADTDSFTIFPVQAEDAGVYLAWVSNPSALQSSSEASLEVVGVLEAIGAWGDDDEDFGQSTVPADLTNIVAVAAGHSHSLALRRNGTVVAWGENGSGENDVPPDLTNVVAIAGGYYSSLALRGNGTVVEWPQSSVPPGLTNLVAIASSHYHSLALRADGTVVAWGDNRLGENEVPTGLANVVAIACGYGHSLALRADGTVVAWGYNYDQATVPTGLTNVVAVAAGASYSLALRVDGTVVAWGTSYGGRRNDLPMTAPAGLSNVVAIAGGGDHSLALRTDGTVVAWGYNGGNRARVPAGLSNVVAIAGGGSHSLALVGDGEPFIANSLLDRLTLAGASAYFQVNASGARPLSYQWQFDGTNLFGATNPILALTNTELTNAGGYSVTISNTLGKVTSRSACFSVIPARFVNQPLNQNVQVGNDSLLSANVESTAPLSYQWRVNLLDLKGATNRTLRLTNVSFASAGGYTVVAANKYGSVTSAVARLTVWEPLVVDVHGRGRAEIESGPYSYGDTVVVTAVPNRWSEFSRWSDGVADNPRGFVIGVTNRYTAIFTNTVPLERWTNQLGQIFEVPEGTPKIYVDDQLTFGGSFSFPDTDVVNVRMESSLDSNALFFSLDGSEPAANGFHYEGQFLVGEPSLIQAVALDPNLSVTRYADPVRISFLPTLQAWTRGGGTAGVQPRLPAYASNSIVTLTATSSNGWQFLYWAGDANSTNPVVQVKMDRTRSVEAVFGTYLTNSAFVGAGEVTRYPVDGPYAFGSGVRLSAIPHSGKHFVAWLDGANGQTDNPLEFTVTNANQHIRALFGSLPPNTFALTTLIDGDGTVSRSIIRNYYTNGVTVSLTAMTNLNQSFTGWSGDASGTQNPLSVVMDSSKVITAHFISTIAPTVTLAGDPPDQTEFGAPATIKLLADAEDSDGKVARVEFRVGKELLATLSQRPFSLQWTNVPVGSYSLTAVAYDNSGLKTTSSPLTIAVEPPALFQFDKAAYAVGEADGSVNVVVTNIGVYGGTVDYELVNVNAVGGRQGGGDYRADKDTLVFANGQKTQGISVHINDDGLPEDTEKFEVKLSNPSVGSTLSQQNVAQVFITDNDESARTNSWFEVKWPDPPATNKGSLQVEVIPEEAHGQWRLPWELRWREPQLMQLPVGNYDVEFRPVSGWEPQTRTLRVSVLRDRTTTVTNEYYSIAVSRKGSLRVGLGPSDTEVVTNGGWRLAQSESTQWLSSGTTLSNLTVGLYLIEFQPVAGWYTPSRRMVEVFEGTSTPVVTENYLVADPPPTGVQFPAALKSFGAITNGLSQVPRLPYAFCGQLQTDVGFGSGVAVQEGVVLTAAHLVFDDQTLTWVEEMNWFFEKQEGEFDPRPIRPRGVHMHSGYASARTNALLRGSAPGQSTQESRLWDVAALYFWEPAARGGYSGYLTSDGQQNDWLVSSKLKVLMGYPVDGNGYGYNGIEAGKMHATEGRNYLFTPEANRVYLSSDFLSFPGNSGGPLCVNVGESHPTYYPAGIYLGTVGKKSAVRSIDTEVVSLIHLAVDSADFGKNFNGGGVSPFAVPNLGIFKVGYVKIEMDPPCVMGSGGAKWWVEGYTNLFSTSEPVPGLAQGYVIRFGGVPGYIAPGQTKVTVQDQQTNTVVGVYRPIQRSGLQVKLQPAEAITAGARWYLVGETNRWLSGTVVNLAPCEYRVGFTGVEGYKTPEAQWVSLSYGTTNVLEVSYRPLLLLSVTAEGRLKLEGTSGVQYQIQVRPDLSTNSVWSNAWTGTLSGAAATLNYNFPTNQQSLFYRAILKP